MEREAYRLRARYGDRQVEIEDPYRFPPLLSDFDLYLLGEGTHMHPYEKLGAHPMVLDGVEGVAFAVFAPAAKRVSVVGDFNFWDGRRHAMRVRGNGFWEIFVHVFNPATRQYPRSRPRACASPGSAFPPAPRFFSILFNMAPPPTTAFILKEPRNRYEP